MPTDHRKNGKDRVLHARIPEYLDEELRNQAGRLGISVSTIVRNTLLHTFDLVGDIVRDSAQIARNLGYPIGPIAIARNSTTQPDIARHVSGDAPVLAWQPGVLNVNGVCDQCNAILPKGSRAGIGVPARERAVFLCLECLQKLEANAPPSNTKKNTAARKAPRSE